MPNFPDSSGVSGKERIRNREFLKVKDIYPKVSLGHFIGPPNRNFLK